MALAGASFWASPIQKTSFAAQWLAYAFPYRRFALVLADDDALRIREAAGMCVRRSKPASVTPDRLLARTDWEHHAGVEGGRLGHIGGCSPPRTPRDNEVKLELRRQSSPLSH